MVLVGCPGSGKSTIGHYLLEIPGSEPIESGGYHGTKELVLGFSTVLEAHAVDSIGQTLDINGMTRVLACVYNKGWDPVAIIAVHTGRPSYLELLASHLQASKVNVIDFSPKPFFKAIKKGHEVDEALELAMGDEEDVSMLDHVKMITLPGEDGGRDRKSTRLNCSHWLRSRMPSSA